MADLALIASWVVAAVLAVSAIAKFADRTGTERALADFGLPAALQRAAPLLPVAELVCAVALVVPATTRVGALGACALLAAFSLTIGVNLARGRRPACNCFGRLDSGPIGPPTLIRNVVLIALAVLAAHPDPSPAHEVFSWVTLPVGIALGVGAVVIAVIGGLVWLVTELWRQQARLLARLDALETAVATGDPRGLVADGHAAEGSLRRPNAGPPLGTSAPRVGGTTASGVAVSLTDGFAPGRTTVVAFGDPDCLACAALEDELGAWLAADRAHRHVIVVSRTAETPVPDGAQVFVEADRVASRAFGVTGTPSALLIDAHGRIASELAEGIDEVRAVLARADAAPGPTSTAPAASPTSMVAAAARASSPSAPAPVRLATRPARAGQVVPELHELLARADDLDGDTTLVLFWNERCSHCQGMVDALRDQHARTEPGAPRLAFVVPSADQAATVTERMEGVVALVDPELRANLALGVPGTPSAALVDADHRLVADLAVGPDAVVARFAPVAAV